MKSKTAFILLSIQLVLILSFKLAINQQFLLSYTYDETIITLISRQPIDQLLDTVKAEPHPPGYYLLLKLLPTHNLAATRNLTTYLFIVPYLFIIAYCYRYRLLDLKATYYSLALFLASYSFLYSSTYLKQDSLSLPLLIFIWLLCWHQTLPKRPQPKFINLLTFILLTALLFIGYIAYALALVTVIIWWLWQRTSQLLVLLALHLGILCVYMYSYGLAQMSLGANRISWLRDTRSSPIAMVAEHLTGEHNTSLITDSLLFIYIALVVYGTYALVRPYQSRLFQIAQKRFELLVIIAIITIGISDELHIFGQTRYMNGPLFLLSVLAGVGLSRLPTKLVYNLVLIGLFSAISLFNYSIGPLIASTTDAEFIKIYESQTQPTGFTTDHPVVPFIYSFQYPSQNVIPVTVYAPGIYQGSTTIEQKHLLLDTITPQLNSQEMATNFAQTDLNRYLYLMTNYMLPTYSRDRTILHTFLLHCSLHRILASDNLSTLFEFDQCDFEAD